MGLLNLAGMKCMAMVLGNQNLEMDMRLHVKEVG
jgi:hypothetical protein